MPSGWNGGGKVRLRIRMFRMLSDDAVKPAVPACRAPFGARACFTRNRRHAWREEVVASLP